MLLGSPAPWLGGRSPAPRVRWRWESLILAPSVAEAGAGAKSGERIGLSKSGDKLSPGVRFGEAESPVAEDHITWN